MAPFGLKLWENAFQMIPNISFFDAGKQKFDNLLRRKCQIIMMIRRRRESANCLFWRRHGFLDVIGRCASKNDPRGFDFQLSTTLGGGVKEMVSLFGHDFWPKMAFTKKVIYEITTL